MSDAIYLDHHATTPVDPAVLQAMLPWFSERPGNPHSRHHEYGWSAEAAVDIARTEVARLLNVDDGDVYFTSGATEANNWAILGMAAAPGRILVSAVEHPCVMEAAKACGRALTVIPVDAGGGVDPAQIQAELDKGDVALVSVMLANHEVGAIQPLAAIGRMTRQAGAWLHCDAAQAAGRIPVDVERLGADLTSLSAHKIYGPKGIGALIVGARARAHLAPLIHGGGQQDNLRSGTVPTPLAVGFGAAATQAADNLEADRHHIGGLRDRLWRGLQAEVTGLALNGPEIMRLPGNLNFRIRGAEADNVIGAAPEIAVSTGAACSATSSAPSPVLQAIGLTEAEIRSSIRIGVGRGNTEAEIDKATAVLARAISEAR